jgi:gluconolactonase
MAGNEPLELDPRRCALVIRDMQNDVAFASSGSPSHCRSQNSIRDIAGLANSCREKTIPVIHVWYLVEPGAPGMTLNAPLFRGIADAKALVAGTWGGEPVPDLAPKASDHIVRKMRMSAWEGTALETVLKSQRRETVIVTGAWTNMR